jgi:hypothetical protein
MAYDRELQNLMVHPYKTTVAREKKKKKKVAYIPNKSFYSL